MRYADYDKRIYTKEDIEKYREYFEKDIADKQKELSEFINRAEKRVEWINQCEKDKKYSVRGRTLKYGKYKEILLTICYEDGTQRNERYSFVKITELRKKLDELKEKYSGVDWSKFEYEI